MWRRVRLDDGALPANRIEDEGKPPVRSTRLGGVSLAFATCVLTMPTALGAAVALARYLPLSEPVRFSIAFALVFPLWGSALLLTALSRDAATAWVLCGVIGLLVWELAYWP